MRSLFLCGGSNNGKKYMDKNNDYKGKKFKRTAGWLTISGEGKKESRMIPVSSLT